MTTLQNISRNRWVMLGALAGLAAYYVLIFRPLAQRAEALEKPLDEVWQELVDFSLESRSVRDLELEQIQKVQETLRASLIASAQLREKISARVELEPEIRAKMSQPFFLIEFQNDRQKRIEQLTALAKIRQVTLEPAALQGFPEFKTETRDPSLLWAQLAIVHHVLTVAINSGVSEVKNVALLPLLQEGGTAKGIWQEIPVRIELAGPTASASHFLSAMPLRAEEIKGAGLPEALPGKPSLFLDRLLLRKQAPEKPDEVSLDVVITGFVVKAESQSRARDKGVRP